MSKTRTITYEVAADYAFAAIAKAVQMLREEVRLLNTTTTEELAPGWWKVTLRVSEDT